MILYHFIEQGWYFLTGWMEWKSDEWAGVGGGTDIDEYEYKYFSPKSLK